MIKQQLLNYVSEKYGYNKEANKLKRVIFKTYSGKYIYYKNNRYTVDEIGKIITLMIIGL